MSTIPAHLTLQQQMLLDHFLRTRGIPLSRERIIAVLYGNDWSGGPEDAATSVRMHILRLRQKLKPHGIDVLTIGIGPGSSGWMLDPEHFAQAQALLSPITIDLVRSVTHS